MDKKTGVIIGIISAVIVVLIAIVFVTESKTEGVDKNVIMTVNGVNYTVDDFNIFAKLVNDDESDDINKNMSEEEIEEMLNDYLIRKIYSDDAKDHDIELESGDLEKFEEDYANDIEKYAKANISKEEYIKYQTEKTLEQTIKNDISKYHELPTDTYNQIVENYQAADLYKSYAFRMINIPYEKETSGDTSGDISGDVTSTTESGDEEDMSREAQLKVAEDVLAKIKSGDDFETLAKEYGSMRLSFTGNNYTLINGEIEYSPAPFLSSKLGNEDLYEAVIKLNSGDVTEIVEDEDYTAFYIVKLEAVEDGFVGESLKELKEVFLSQYADDIVAQNTKYEVNQSAFIRVIYGNI